ncbi:MAG: type II toxin-antitoxin system HicB family antitoxin [Acidimicrobiia bacterium]
MKRVTIQYHCDGKWWADSPDFPGYTAVADSFTELRDMVMEGIDFVAGEPVIIVEEASLFADAITEGDAVQAKGPDSGNIAYWEYERVALAG